MNPQLIKGAPDEIKFWQKFVRTAQFKTWLADIPTPELRPEVKALIRPGDRVLDVGSGVLSILHGTVTKGNLVSVDLLASEYKNFFDYRSAGLTPPLAIAAEDLNFTEEFDVVHMSNALDHCQNPIIAFQKLVQAAKWGGIIIVIGFENEGSYLHGAGMHQWDLFLIQDRLGLKGVDGKSYGYLDSSLIQPKALLASTVDLPSGRRWVLWAGKKWKGQDVGYNSNL